MGLLHTYTADVVWTGAGAEGTTGYRTYSRDHTVHIAGKPDLLGSADPAFRGDPTRHTPEDLLVTALSQCHMLWFLHLASADGLVVVGYQDRATGTMRTESAGHGHFTDVVLRPRVTLRLDGPGTGDGPADPTDGSQHPTDLEARVARVHESAHDHCFIARSVNFPVRLEPAPLEREALRR
ncbi:OsmC family protein [Cellulomonas hominis]